MKMSKRRLSLILVGIAMIAVTGFVALSQTWVTASAMMHLTQAGSSAQLKVFWDCGMTGPVTDIDWGPVTSGQRYVRSVFVVNPGTVMLYVTYLPTWWPVPPGQYKFHIECFIHMEGTPCQLNKPPSPIPMVEKDINTPTIGYELYPGCMIKVDIRLTVESIEVGKTYDFPFEFHGYMP